jgi:NtrC-family two-component system sensor histidine kinase KinB
MFKTLFTTLRAKILAGYIVVILIMIAVMVWSLYNFNRLNESFRAIIAQNYTSIVAADNMVKSLDDQVNGLFLIFSQGNRTDGEKIFESAKQDFFFWFETAREAAYNPEETQVLDSLNSQYMVFLSEVSFLVANPLVYTSHLEKENEYSKAISLITVIKNQCYRVFETNHVFIKRAEERVQSITRIAAFTMLFLAILGTVLSLIFSTKFSTYIVKPVKDLTRSVKHISAGNFDQIIQSSDSDEIGILADEFNSMVGRLQKYEKMNISKMLYEKRKSEIIIESINEPVLMVDGQMNILLANKAFSDEFESSKTDKTDLKKILRDEKIFDSIRTFLETGESQNEGGVFRFINDEGLEKFYKLRFSLINLPENEVKACLIVFSDITKYEELDRLKSEFVAKVSHELKTPLTSMGMAVGILGDGVAGSLSKKQLELISSMKEDYNRLNKLVKEILELSRIESGGIKLDYESVDLNLLLKETVKAFDLQCKEKNISINFTINDNLPIITADYDYLSRAIGNFIGNSIKFTQIGGEINVDAQENGAFVKIIISDTGMGINPDYLDKIFDKFVQVSGSKPGSVGLGLTIAKEIIELHQGSINVWSKPGQGSKFEITIPVLQNA